MTWIEQHIPPMTHEYARYWDQPPRDEVLVDERHAVMSAATLAQLHEYSASIPTGVYAGKMWLRREPGGLLLLCWYSDSVKPGHCGVNHRPILLVDDPRPAASDPQPERSSR